MQANNKNNRQKYIIYIYILKKKETKIKQRIANAIEQYNDLYKNGPESREDRYPISEEADRADSKCLWI